MEFLWQTRVLINVKAAGFSATKKKKKKTVKKTWLPMKKKSFFFFAQVMKSVQTHVWKVFQKPNIQKCKDKAKVKNKNGGGGEKTRLPKKFFVAQNKSSQNFCEGVLQTQRQWDKHPRVTSRSLHSLAKSNFQTQMHCEQHVTTKTSVKTWKVLWNSQTDQHISAFHHSFLCHKWESK